MFMVRDSDNISVKLEDLNVVLGDGTVLKRFVSQANFEGINKIRKKLVKSQLGRPIILLISLELLIWVERSQFFRYERS